MQSVRPLPERFFSDGMNNADKPEYLKEGQCVRARNVLLANEDIDKGPGTVSAFDLGFSTACQGGISTSSEMYGAFNNGSGTYTDIYWWNGSGTPTALSANLTASTHVNFVDTGTAVYAFNGIDPVVKLVGATFTQPAGIPLGSFGAWVNNRMYIGGLLASRNILWYSDVNAPDTYGVNNYIDVFPDDRSYMTGLASFNGTLVIAKRDNMLTFDGFTVDDFTIKRVKDQLANAGCMSHQSIINTGDDLLFMSFSGFIPHIRSLRRTQFQAFNDGGIISKDIEGTMKTVNKDRLGQVCGGFDGRFAWWSMPTGSSLTNNLTICKDMTKEGSKGWTVHDENLNANVFFRSSVAGRDRFYFGNADAESKVFYLDQNIGSRDGNALEWEFESRDYQPDTSRKNKFKYLYTTTGTDAATTIYISASPDGFTYELQDQFSTLLGVTGFPYTFPFFFGSSSSKRRRTSFTTPQANTMRVKFTESSTEKVSISEYELFYYTRGLRDV